MKFQLTINVNYCADWGLWEAVREVIQNALDSHDLGNEMKVSHHGTLLRVSNVGVKLDKRVWMMGVTSKDGRDDQRGQFGEGLKLGVLAALRDGHDVKIINDNESWTPTLEESEIFEGEKVIAISTRAREATGKFTVEIDGVGAEVWADMSRRFLFLAKPKRVEHTEYADVLLDEDMAGKIFVKGILVKTNPSLDCGYNLKRATVDRDRRMVDDYDSRYGMMQAWQEVATRDPAHFTKLVTMLEGAKPDLDGLHRYNVEAGLLESMVAAFKVKYGEDALPVLSMAEATEAGHYGKRGVVLPATMVDILTKALGGVGALRESFRHAVKTSFSPSDLTPAEHAILSDAMNIVRDAANDLGYDPSIVTSVCVVEFVGDGLNGLFCSGEVKLARKLLSSFEETIRVLVHEVAHAKGEDGEKAHEVAEGQLFSRIVRRQLDDINNLLNK